MTALSALLPREASNDYRGGKLDLTRELKKAFDENGIEIPFPQRTIHMLKDAA